MKKIITRILTSSAFLACLASSALLATSCGDKFERAINDNMGSEEVLLTLNELITHDKFIAYNDAAHYFEKADADPDQKGNIILYYTGESYTIELNSYGTGPYQINNEHVWCQSRFRIYSANPNANEYSAIRVPSPYSDLYNIRPCLGIVNTDRSNYMYAENTVEGSLKPFDPANYKGAKEEYRGDIARILFYDATRYLKLKLIDYTDAPTTSSYEMGCLSDLLAWNLKYAPSKLEKNRNDAIEKIQGNRNPFVDHPEYACRIWGATNDKTKQICGIN